MKMEDYGHIDSRRVQQYQNKTRGSSEPALIT